MSVIYMALLMLNLILKLCVFHVDYGDVIQMEILGRMIEESTFAICFWFERFYSSVQ